MKHSRTVAAVRCDSLSGIAYEQLACIEAAARRGRKPR
jgi:hypothetical protein